MDHILTHWTPGLVVPATVTHLEPFGAFVDIGCGAPSMIGVERLSVSRIAHAEQLLIEPNLSITEVAMRSGFNSLSTFNRIFKAAKNCTPSEYKNLNKSEK